MMLHLLNIRACCCHSHFVLHKEGEIGILSTANNFFVCGTALLEHPLKYLVLKKKKKYLVLITSLCQKTILLPLICHHPVLFYMYQYKNYYIPLLIEEHLNIFLLSRHVKRGRKL